MLGVSMEKMRQMILKEGGGHMGGLEKKRDDPENPD